MDARVFLTAFGIVFLAEMGDKTQLAALTLAASSGKAWSVFLGAACALCLVTAIGVWAGRTAIGLVSPRTIQRAAAVLFFAAGAWTWARA